jgi:hypothetical protein
MRTLADEIEALLHKRCSSMCLDNEDERKAVAWTIAHHLEAKQIASENKREEERSSDIAEPR